MKEIKYIVTLRLFAHSADANPPLGTVLGNLGVNTIKFCKEFNEYTLDLPDYFQVNVKIFILENKSFSFKVFVCSVGYVISLLKFEKENDMIEFVNLSEIIKLARFKFPNCLLEFSLPMLISAISATDLVIEDDLENLLDE